MGRPKDSATLRLFSVDGGPIPEFEFDMLNEPNFSVPLESIKVKENEETVIPGLKTRELALTNKYLDHKNIFSVKAVFEAALGIPNTCFVISGSTTVEELSALVHNNCNLDAGTVIEILVDGMVLADDAAMAQAYKTSASSDGSLGVLCRLVNEAEG